MYLESDFTYELPTRSTTSASQAQSPEHSYAIKAEELEFVQRNQIRRVPSVQKGTYSYKNPEQIDKLLREGFNRSRVEFLQRLLIFCKCYFKDHIDTQCTLDYDNLSDEVGRNYEALILKEMGQVPPGAYFRLKHLVNKEKAKERSLIQFIPQPKDPKMDSAKIPTIITLQTRGTSPGGAYTKRKPPTSIPLEPGQINITPVVEEFSAPEKFLFQPRSEKEEPYIIVPCRFLSFYWRISIRL